MLTLYGTSLAVLEPEVVVPHQQRQFLVGLHRELGVYGLDVAAGVQVHEAQVLVSQWLVVIEARAGRRAVLAPGTVP